MKKSRILTISVLLCAALFSGCTQKGNMQEETLADASVPAAEKEAGTAEDNREAETEKEPEDIGIWGRLKAVFVKIYHWFVKE